MPSVLQADPSRILAPRHVWSQHTLPVTDLHCGFGGPMARVATASLDQTVKVVSLTWAHKFLAATGSQLEGRETGLPCPGCLSSRQPQIPMPNQGHPEMDCPACLLEIPTCPRISGQMPLSVWACLFVTGTVLEKEPGPCICETSVLPD